MPTTARERFNISRLALKYPWITVGFWVTVSIAGLWSFGHLKYALFPDVTFPVVVVNASYSTTGAEATETQLTRPLETRLKTIPGVDKVRSASYPGQTVISLAFGVGTELEEAGRIVEAAVKAEKLPKGTTFKVTPLNLNESAAVSYTIESESGDLKSAAKLVREQVVPTIAKLPGVLRVVLLGDPTVFVNPSAVRFDGKDALAVQVIKRGRANTLEVVRDVEAEMQRLRSVLPTVRINLAATQATYIREASNATVEALGLAIALSVLVIFPFLWNWRATLISALAIPLSLLGTFIVMAVFGFNLETITLLALALVIGIIVDDAIVDVENIARHIEEGEPPAEAAVSATDEIGLTVTAATMTIVAVFLPVGLMSGVLGQFFRPFGLTVSAAVLTSLLVARTLSPLLASWWLKPAKPHRPQALTFFKGGLALYQQMLGWALKHRAMVVAAALASFALGLALIPIIPKGFIPHLDRGEFNVNFTTALGTGIDDSRTIATQLEKTVRATPEVEAVFTTIGTRPGETNRGTLYVKLDKARTRTTQDVQGAIRTSLPTMPATAISIEDLPFVENGAQKPLEVAFLGEDLGELNRAVEAVKARIEKIPGYVDVAMSGAGRYQDQVVEISHLNGRRVIYLTSNLAPGFTIGEATDRFIAEAKTVLPPSVSLSQGGDAENVASVFSGFAVTLALSIVCILGVLLLLFRSLTDAFVVILSLPLAVVGAMLAQFVTGSEFGMISVIGIIFLLGLVNKNGVLLVDYINQLRARGMGIDEAILKAGPVRLRPILMTTAAMILGMLPIALGLGAGAELRAPMAIAIIGGLVTSTLLSLIVVPVVYSLLEQRWSRRYEVRP